MPVLDSDIVPLIEAQEIRTNIIVEILTTTPRRFTNYRGLTSDGRRGLIVGGQYYRSSILEVPGIEESDDSAPVRVSVSIGNADNTNLDLYSNTANLKKPITITKVWFTGSTWAEALAPAFELEPWLKARPASPRSAANALSSTASPIPAGAACRRAPSRATS